MFNMFSKWQKSNTEKSSNVKKKQKSDSIIFSKSNQKSFAELFSIQQRKWDMKFEPNNEINTSISPINSIDKVETEFMESSNLIDSICNIFKTDSKSEKVIENDLKFLDKNLGNVSKNNSNLLLYTQNNVNIISNKLKRKLSEIDRNEINSEFIDLQVISQNNSNLSNNPNFEIPFSSSDYALSPIINHNTKNKLDSPINKSKMYSPENKVSSVPINSQIKIVSPNKNNSIHYKKMPYYLENFKTIINVVISDEFWQELFDQSDKNYVDQFINNLSLKEQMLYSRLYLRKHRWLRKDQMEYLEISEDLNPFLDSLVEKGFLFNAQKMTDLGEILNCLNLKGIKNLAKSCKLNYSLQKSELVCLLISHSKKTSIGNFFRDNSSMDKVLMKRAIQFLGPCYKLNPEYRSIYLRIMILSALHNTISDDDFSGQQQIFQMLQATHGLVKFPCYVINRKSKVFSNKQHLIDYSEALNLETELWHELEKKNNEEAYKVYQKIKLRSKYFLKNEDEIKFISNLPEFLRIFSPGAAYVRMLNRSVNVLQSLKLFDEAVHLLQELLDQKLYHQDYRGRWFDRLTLNLDFHLKKSLQALEYIEMSLRDKNVRTGHRYDLLQRGQKIISQLEKKKIIPTVDIVFITSDPMNWIQESNTVCIEGNQIPKVQSTSHSVWLLENQTEFVSMVRVEDLALAHYASNGYPQGIHGESLTLTTLFMLFCWDIVFMNDIPDVFFNPFQTAPLDFRTDYFYISRKHHFKLKLELIAKSSNEELSKMALLSWEENYDSQCSAISWEIFQNSNQMQGLVKCFGGLKLSKLFDRMAQQMRFVRGGVPDLIVWNQDALLCKLVEVKGPGDKLSSKQILWIDYLLSIGIDVEVCYVKASNAKRLTSK